MLEEYLNRMAQGTIPQEDVVFRRFVLTEPLTEEALLQSTVPLSEVTFTTNSGIEDFPQSSYVVFANEVPFNGCFSSSCTQEQIMCMLFPEACLGKHIFDPMEPLEAISVSGCVRVGTYSGYGYRLRYEGPYTESSCRIGFRSRTTTPAQLRVMDALCCEGKEQFAHQKMLREINKAYCAFSMVPAGNAIASGKWGCGVFNGDPYLKSLLQWVSASLVGKKVVEWEVSYE